MIWYALFLLVVQNAAAWRYTDDDLMSFMTLPDARAVRFDIETLDRNRTAPGYWFVSPYLHIEPDEPSSEYEQYQIGPHIYDEDGILIWTGSMQFDNRNVFDFKAINSFDNKTYLSMILQYSYDGGERGYGMILNEKYETYRKLPLRTDLGVFDIHEFNVRKDGKSALVTVYLSEEVELTEFGRPNEKTFLEIGGFAEIDTTTAEILYDWKSYNQIPLSETVHYFLDSVIEGPPGWDYVHINSVDKNEAGDYLISMRFTNTLYMVSGLDGKIMWRLNGVNGGDFDSDFLFSKQHDAKFLESSGTHHVISFLNNASDEEFQEETISAALIVEVETGTTPMTARVVKRYNRPDGDLTRLRGNSQVLPNNNMFVCWSQGGYISEHSPEGDVLMIAKFTSPRFSNYRAYKFEFTGRPTIPPDVVASVWGTDETNLVTTIWVSWNGATDVVSYNFYAQASEFDKPIFVGNISKAGFESMFMAAGYVDWVSVEAVDRNGNVMGTSQVKRTRFPDWENVGWSGYSSQPRPQNPSRIFQSVDGFSTDKSIDDSSFASFDGTAEAQNRKTTQTLATTYDAIRSIGGMFALILLLAVMSGIMASYLLIRGWRVHLYQRVPKEESYAEEERLRPDDD
ncbi:uncharacterized protein N7498_009704 [Penicillium cinerascens]|uniref:ASST-domain-containing protein n=1 Tax=Penicillium cinerascens TaxID=70096 RepID=A0A9W9M6P1_9EURO|nr:uncharacterized protein N7498_009704 [Penicillium cinerascens]KAJ5190719.1 hypothetical protein N7498_009704 [Penicillium cinerascens]